MKILSHKIAFFDDAQLAAGLPFHTDVDKLPQEPPKALQHLASAPPGSGEDPWLGGVYVFVWLCHSEVIAAHLLRYHFLEVVSSQSKQHAAHKCDLSNPDRWDPDTDPERIRMSIEDQEHYKACLRYVERAKAADYTPKGPNDTLEVWTEKAKKARRRFLRNLPLGFRSVRAYAMSYRQLKTIWLQRHDHREDEWRAFCDWIMTLPDFACLTGLRSTKEDKHFDELIAAKGTCTGVASIAEHNAADLVIALENWTHSCTFTSTQEAAQLANYHYMRRHADHVAKMLRAMTGQKVRKVKVRG
jgi:hypothetical protein